MNDGTWCSINYVTQLYIIYIYMSRMDTETSRQYEQSLFIRHTNNPKITTYVLQQNIYNQTQEQHSHANIYTV